jgi:hypothetical protein
MQKNTIKKWLHTKSKIISVQQITFNYRVIIEKDCYVQQVLANYHYFLQLMICLKHVLISLRRVQQILYKIL